jgi:hypothetical protein
MADDLAQRLTDSCSPYQQYCICSVIVTDEEIKQYGESGLEKIARLVAKGCTCKQGRGTLSGHQLTASCASDPTKHNL